MEPAIKIAFASGTDDLNARLIERMRSVFPELPLYVVSEFPPAASDLHWIRYRGGFFENLARCRSAFRCKKIRLAGVLLVPNVPFRRMRVLALILAPFYFLAINENLNDFMLRPRSLPAIARHFVWRIRNFVRWHLGENGALAKRGWHDLPYLLGLVIGYWRPGGRTNANPPPEAVFCSAESEATPNSFTYALHGDERSHYDPAKLAELGGPDPAYSTQAVQYLDLCYRAWQRGWSTIRAAGIPPESTAFDPIDYLKFLAHTAASPVVFRNQWRRALQTLHANADTALLWKALPIALQTGRSVVCALPEQDFLALANGTVTVYSGKPATGKPRILIVSAYLPFPLSHGGAVRIHNLTERAATDWDQILVCFVETDALPPPELLSRFIEIVLVKREGSHSVPQTGRPEVVEQFASASFSAALRRTVRNWQPAIAQLEFTQMGQYAVDCAPARPILIEHDITFDLYQQLAQNNDDWDLKRELNLWRRFETAAWREMACVVAMSTKDEARITGTRAVTLPNGVDLDRFRVPEQAPEPGRILFVGSFSHLPNLMAVEFFLNHAWGPLSQAVPDARLHIIAGANHEYFLDYQSHQVHVDLTQPGFELEGFVADVRPAYSRAQIVIAPLVASAGTNLKILEAMACGRPVVSTPAGVNGLDLTPGEDFILAQTGQEMADAIAFLLASPEECSRLAAAGRRRVEDSYDWDSIAKKQNELYRSLLRT